VREFAAQVQEIAERYPDSRSAVLPALRIAQHPRTTRRRRPLATHPTNPSLNPHAPSLGVGQRADAVLRGVARELRGRLAASLHFVY